MKPRAAGLVCALVGVGVLLAPALPAAASAGEDRLRPHETLRAGEALVSPDGSQTLVLQTGGQLALYGAGTDPRWVTDAGTPGDHLAVTRTGDVRLVAQDGRVLWRTHTSGHAHAALLVRDDGDVVVGDRGGHVLWDAGTAVTPSILTAGHAVGAGGQLASPDGRQTLVVGTDGRVALLGPDGTPRWATPTATPGSRLELRDDGNLVVVAPDGTLLWRSRTAGHPGASLSLKDDGELALYAASGARLWGTDTALGPPVLAAGDALAATDGLASPDGHLRLRATTDALVLSYDDQRVWQVPVDLPAGGALTVQDDGGLALVAPDGTTVWSTATGQNPGAALELEESAALLRTPSGVELWREDVPAKLVAAAEAAEAAQADGAAGATGTTGATGPAVDCAQVTGPVPEEDTAPTSAGVRVNRCLADSVDALVAAAAADGVTLAAGSGWRSAQEQAALRQAHCVASQADPSALVCEPATAPVGASMHERGLALDFTQDGRTLWTGSTGFAWLVVHASAYGLHNLPTEPWHWSTNGW